MKFIITVSLILIFITGNISDTRIVSMFCSEDRGNMCVRNIGIQYVTTLCCDPEYRNKEIRIVYLHFPCVKGT
jgi:hypothetical protein